MDASLLVDWHLVFFEIKISDTLLEYANQQIVRERVLIGKTGCRDGLKPLEKIFVRLMALSNGGNRVLRKLVIVAVVAVRGGALRSVTEIGLILLFKKSVLCGQTVCNRFGVLGESGNCYCE